MRCPTCGQQNHETALMCEFCKTVFQRKGQPPRAPPPKAQPPAVLAATPSPVVVQTGLGLPGVLLVALLSGGAGFALHGLVIAPRTIIESVPVPMAVAPQPQPRAVPVEKPVERPQIVLRPAPPPVEAPVVEPPVPAPVVAPEAAAPEPARIIVPYKHLEGLAQRIIIPVTLNGSLTVAMALDTGAPGTILSTPLAERLGLMREGEGRMLTTAGGIGGSAPAALVILDSIAVQNARTDFVPATVTELPSNDWYGLVGMDFLAGYAVSIDTEKHVLVLTPQPPRSNAPAGHDEAWWRRTFQVIAGQRARWKTLHASVQERASRLDVSAGGEAETLKKLLPFVEREDEQAEGVMSKLERYASTASVPLEWRRP